MSLIDRLLHHAVVVVTAGESFRMREARTRGGCRSSRTEQPRAADFQLAKTADFEMAIDRRRRSRRMGDGYYPVVTTDNRHGEELIMGQPVVHFEIIGNDPEKLRGYYGAPFGSSTCPRRWHKRYRNRRGTGSWTSSPRRMGLASAVVSAADRVTRATLSSTLGPECRGCVAASRKPRGHTGNRSGHFTEWPCCRSLHGPRRHPDRHRRRRMRAAPGSRISGLKTNAIVVDPACAPADYPSCAARPPDQ